MKATELMIGDWVMFNHNPVRVAILGAADKSIGLAAGKNVFGQPFSMIDPIPITAEILEKNGFKKQYGNDWCYYKYKDDDTSKESLYYILYDIDSLYLEIAAFTNASGEYNRMGVCYVHELQHTLKLCGIDKEIDLWH